jgi:hypothetical protein
MVSEAFFVAQVPSSVLFDTTGPRTVKSPPARRH